MHTVPDMTGFLVRKTSTLTNSLAYCCYCGSQQQHILTICTFFIFRYMKSLNSVDLFYPDLTLISIETGCQARWRIAVATHVLHPKALKCYLRRQHFKVERQQGTSESKFSFTSCLWRYLLLNEFWRQHRCIIRCLWYPTKIKDGIWKLRLVVSLCIFQCFAILMLYLVRN